MELGHLSYKNATFEHYVGDAGLKRLGRKKWQKHVEFGVAPLIDALHPDDVVLGGGNARNLKELPAGCRVGDNANAFEGGFRMWSEPSTRDGQPAPGNQSKQLEDKHDSGSRDRYELPVAMEN
jgi:polyphosphate glucokinase